VREFHVVALAGKSGSGKSLAADYLASKGVPVIDGDMVARDVVAPGSDCLRLLAEEFGTEILLEDGSLDRRKLGELCFSNSSRKERLDAIIHPFILSDMKRSFEELGNKGFKYCVVQAPALIESGFQSLSDRIVLITAEREKQIERITARDGIEEKAAGMRLDAQICEQRLRELADVEIENNGTKEEFLSRLNSLRSLFSEWFSDKIK